MWNYSSGMKRFFFFFFSFTVFGKGLELRIRASSEKNRGSPPPPGWASAVKVHFFSLLLMKRLKLLTQVFFQILCTLTTLRLLSRQKPWSQVSSFLLSRFLPSIFIAHYHTGFIQRSRSSSIFWRVLLTQAFALSAKVNSCSRKNLYEYSRVCTRRASFYLPPPTDLTWTKPDACYDRELHHFFSEVFSIWELKISPTQKLIRRKLKLVPGEKFHGLDTQRKSCKN